MSDHDKFYLVSMFLFFILGWISAAKHTEALTRLRAHMKRSTPSQDPSRIAAEYDYNN